MRMVSDARGESYEERLRAVGLTSLEEQRERSDMIETFKTMRGIKRVERDEWFMVREEEEARSTRSNMMVVSGEAVRRKEVVSLERANLEIRRQYFNVRVGPKWNELPDEVKQQKNVNGLKNQYDKWRRKQQLREEINATAKSAPQGRDESRQQAQTGRSLV